MKGYITKITTQKKNKERFNIYIDQGHGEEYGFSVDQDVFVKFHLKKGMSLDEFELEDIFFEDEIKKAFNLALNYLSFKMRSTKEVSDFLKQKEVAEPIILEVLHKLTSYHYIDDHEYANAYVRTQKNTTDKGPVIIKKELAEKGILPNLIDESLQQFTQNEQIEAVVKISEKFLGKDKNLSRLQKKAKLEQLCLRKGFSISLLEIALEKINMEQDDDVEWSAIQHQGEKAFRKYGHLHGWEFKQKMKQALYQKGFPLDLIEKYVDSFHEE